jgi:cell filamentation protein
MSDSYRYIDPEYVYTDPITGVLRNLADIDDHHTLNVFERLKVGLRLEELQQKPLKIKSSDTLFEIHKHLFQDVYQWAGHPRTVEISRGGTPFFPRKRFPDALAFIDVLVSYFRN